MCRVLSRLLASSARRRGTPPSVSAASRGDDAALGDAVEPAGEPPPPPPSPAGGAPCSEMGTSWSAPRMSYDAIWCRHEGTSWSAPRRPRGDGTPLLSLVVVRKARHAKQLSIDLPPDRERARDSGRVIRIYTAPRASDRAPRGLFVPCATVRESTRRVTARLLSRKAMMPRARHLTSRCRRARSHPTNSLDTRPPREKPPNNRSRHLAARENRLTISKYLAVELLRALRVGADVRVLVHRLDRAFDALAAVLAVRPLDALLDHDRRRRRQRAVRAAAATRGAAAALVRPCRARAGVYTGSPHDTGVRPNGGGQRGGGRSHQRMPRLAPR